MGDSYNLWKGDHFEFNLRNICEIIDYDISQLPKNYIDFLDVPCKEVTYNSVSEFDGLKVCFDLRPEKENRVRFETYLKNGVVVFSENEYYSKDGNKLPIIQIEDINQAWIKIGQYIKECFPMPTIGITGSVGKTTTVLFSELIFAEKYNVFVSGPDGKNYNTPPEIVRQMILRYGPEYNFHIQETGGGRSRLIEESAELLGVDAFGITKISKEHHIDRYIEADDIIADKTSFDRHRKEKTFGVINLDDEVLKNHKFDSRIITYAVNNQSADYIGTNITRNGKYLEFDVKYEDKCTHIKINIVGRHNVYNALMAFALAKQFDISDKQIADGFLKYKSGAIRQSIRDIAGRLFYIDCFNICSDSIKSCMETLKELPPQKGGKRIAVLGGENALGDKSFEVNFRTGTELDDTGIDYLIFAGPGETASAKELNYYGNSIAVCSGAKKVARNAKILSFDSIRELAMWLLENTNPGDIILLKGIFRWPLFAALDIAFGTCYVPYNPNFKKTPVQNDDYTGDFIGQVGGVNISTSRRPQREEIVIPSKIGARWVYRLGKSLYEGNRILRKVKIEPGMKTIGERAFADCDYLSIVDLPKTFRMIEEEAFSGCECLEVINLKGVMHIEDRAFEKCRSLKVVFISEKCSYIGDDAFKGCKNLIIYAPKNSYAEKYANKYGIQVINVANTY